MLAETPIGVDTIIIGAVISLMTVFAAWKGISQLWLWIRTPNDTPESLFRQLANAHRLTKQERILLNDLRKRIADSELHASLFINPCVWVPSQVLVDRAATSKTAGSKSNAVGQTRIGNNPPASPSSLQADLFDEAEQKLFEKIFGFEMSRFPY